MYKGAELAKYDELHRDERLLRQGWGVVMGRTVIDGKQRRVRIPLVSRPIRLATDPEKQFRQLVRPAGDIEVHSELEGTILGLTLEAVFDPERRSEEIRDLHWLRKAAETAGFAIAGVRDTPPPPDQERSVRDLAGRGLHRP